MGITRIDGRGIKVPAIAAAVALLIGMLASPASADAEKTYTLTVGASNEALEVGVAGTVDLVLTNTANPQELGSANVMVPDGISVDGGTLSMGSLVGGVIELRDLSLAPGTAVHVTFTATAVCDASFVPYAWTSSAKQSNDFSGLPGNGFDLSGLDPETFVACSLAFSGQPASAEKDATITQTTFDPSGSPVQVTVLDAAGDPLGAWTEEVSVAVTGGSSGAVLSGDADVAPSGGVASFGDLSIDTSGGGYSLAATTGTSLSTTSGAFDIVDSVTTCSGGPCNSGPVGNGDTTADVTSDAEAGSLLLVSVVADGDGCSDAFSGDTSDTVVFDVTDDGAAKTAAVTWSAPTGTHTQLEVCFEGPSPFTQADGSPATLNADGFYEGILEDCRGRGNPMNLPCVGERTKNRDGSVTLVIYAPAGDPRVRIG